jgi:hypothetical protein
MKSEFDLNKSVDINIILKTMSTVSEFGQSWKALRELIRRKLDSTTSSNESLSSRLLEVFLRTWDLGLIAFGGSGVHFQIFYVRFVEAKGGEKWIDEQTVI